MEKIDLVKEALKPFGLAIGDDKAWSALQPVSVELAHRYNFRRGSNTVPRPGQVIRSLDAVEKASNGLKKAAEAFIGTIGALDDVALEYMLAYDDPDPLFARGRPGTAGPSEAPAAFKHRRDHLFAQQFEDYDRLVNQQFREFASKTHSMHPEWIRAADDLFDARSQFEELNRSWQQQVLESATDSAERRKIDQLVLDSQRDLEKKERAFRMMTLRMGAFFAPAPHFFRDGLKERASADLTNALRLVASIGELAGRSGERFRAASPIDKGGFSPLFLGKPPKYLLAEEYCEVIFYAFGASGFDLIQSTKEGYFANLLRAAHEFATGEEASGDAFREALERIDELRGHIEGRGSSPS